MVAIALKIRIRLQKRKKVIWAAGIFSWTLENKDSKIKSEVRDSYCFTIVPQDVSLEEDVDLVFLSAFIKERTDLLLVLYLVLHQKSSDQLNLQGKRFLRDYA